MAAVELKFIPVGYVNPKSQRGKPGRFELDDPLNVSSRVKNIGERGNKFFVVFSMRKVGIWQGTPKLSTEIFNQDNTLVYTGERFFNQAGFDLYSKDRIDISSGIFLKAGQVLDTVEFEPGIDTKMIHGTAVIMANGMEVSNVVTFSMQGTGIIHGTDFDRTRGQQTTTKKPTVISGTKPFEKPERISVFKTEPKEPVIITGTKPFEKPERVSVFKTTVSKAPIEILPMAAAEPEQLPTKCYMVFGRKLELTQDAVNYYKNIGVKIEECKIDLDFNGVSTPVTTQGGEEILVTEPTEPAQLPSQALPIGFTGIIAGLIVLGGLFSWGEHKRRKK